MIGSIILALFLSVSLAIAGGMTYITKLALFPNSLTGDQIAILSIELAVITSILFLIMLPCKVRNGERK